MNRKNDINSMDNSHDIWMDYVATPVESRSDFVREILADKRTEEGLRGLMFFFQPDRKAYLDIFREWVLTRAMDEQKQEKVKVLTTFSIMDACVKRTPWGQMHDLDKTAIAYGTIISQYPENVDFMDSMQFMPSHAKKINKETESVRNALLARIENGHCVASFSVPVYHFYDYETEEAKSLTNYPQEILREIEMDYLKMNAEDGKLSGQDDDMVKVPMLTQLHFSEDGQIATFKFLTDNPVDQESQEALSEYALSWLKGQLSDGFGEDLTRYTYLSGNQELTPVLVGDLLRETPVQFAGTEAKQVENSQHVAQETTQNSMG